MRPGTTGAGIPAVGEAVAEVMEEDDGEGEELNMEGRRESRSISWFKGKASEAWLIVDASHDLWSTEYRKVQTDLIISRPAAHVHPWISVDALAHESETLQPISSGRSLLEQARPAPRP